MSLNGVDNWNCQVVFSPRISLRDTFWTKMLKDYQNLKNNPIYYSIATQLRVPHVMSFIKELKKEEKICDLGCGNAFFSALCAHKGLRAYGIDPDINSLKQIYLLYSEVDSLIDLINGTIEQIPIKDSSVNAVISLHVLEHVKDLEKSISEIYWICRNFAKILITIPSTEGLFGTYFLRIEHGNNSAYERDYRDGFIRGEISELLEKQSIKIKKISYSSVLISELFMGLTKACYRIIKGRNIKGQYGILKAPCFYRVIFPLVLIIRKLEEKYLSNLLNGHMLNIEGIVDKNDFV